MKKTNSFLNAILPAILMQLATGSVYCFSVYQTELSKIFDCNVNWLFTIVIGMLGIFAAFSGKLVEKDIKKSSYFAMLLFFIGMTMTGLGIEIKNTIIITLGFVMLGCGTGISYVCPVKNLVLYFPNNKGITSAIPIAAFGLGKAIFSPIMLWLIHNKGVGQMFLILSLVFLFMMLIAFVLIKRPANYKEPKPELFAEQYFNQVFDRKKFFVLFSMFFISVTNGLIIIGNEKQIISYTNNAEWIIGLTLVAGALFNCFGRFFFSWYADKRKKDKLSVYIDMSIFGMIASALLFIATVYKLTFCALVGIVIVNMVYGGFFSTLVVLIIDFFGTKNLSTIHSKELLAWSLGALASFGILTFISIHNSLIYLLVYLTYFISAEIGVYFLKKEKKKQQQIINNNNNNNEKYVTKKDYYVYHDENGESYYFYHKRGKVFIGHAKVAEGDLPAEFIGVEIAKRKAYIKEKKDRALETRKVIRHYESIAKAQEKAIKKAQKDLNNYLKDIDDKMALIIKIRRKRENESDID